jgi:hypothetical protein
MPKIVDYPETDRVAKDDVFLLDGAQGTRKALASWAAVELAGLISPINHCNVFRGKNLGGGVSSAQKAAIKNGSFDNLYIGDYWTINGVTWRIADMDYFLRCGDTDFTSHHLVIVPDTQLYTGKMNETHTTEGGYVGSLMYKSGLDQAKTAIAAAFGNLVTTHRDILCNAVSNGRQSGGGWFDSTVELMCERMVYGNSVFQPGCDGSFIPYNYTTGKSQFALFRMAPQYISNRQWYWLRDVVSAAGFADVGDNGNASCYNAGYVIGVRPYFVISVA